MWVRFWFSQFCETNVSYRVFDPLFFINWVDHKVSETGSHVRFDYERVSAWVIGKIKGDDVVFMLFESSNESTIVVA